MESEELKALSFVRRSLLRKNEKIRDLTHQLSLAKDEIEALKNYQWKCADLEEEVKALRNELNVSYEQIPSEQQASADDFSNDAEYLDTEHVTEHNNYEGDLPDAKRFKSDEIKTESVTDEPYNANNSSTDQMPNSNDSDTTSNAVFAGAYGADGESTEAESHIESSEVLMDNGNFDNLESDPGGSGIDLAALATVADGGTPLQLLPLSGPGRPKLPQLQTSLDSVHRTCIVCGKVFSHLGHYNQHLRIHTGEKPFKCRYCNYRSARRGTLKRHVISRHMRHVIRAHVAD